MNNQQIVEHGMEIMSSYYEAMNEAGGNISLEQLKNMTAFELISTLATNNIRFINTKK